ncbi:MAG: DUF4430 domain-containing protein [Clostridiales bacterium]|nr:DUF4430 domain-containing protein [Clostridiales bacterium]
MGKHKIIAGIIIAGVLALVFRWGGAAPGLRGWNLHGGDNTNINQAQTGAPSKATENADTAEPARNAEDIPVREAGESATEENKPHKADNTPMTAEEKAALAQRMAEGTASNTQNGNIGYSKENGKETDGGAEKNSYRTEPVPIEPENAVISDKQLTCTLSVRCDTILKNIAWLDSEKSELVPKDGVIYAEQTVTFYEGESVFNLLVREMKRNKIHMEFENTPIYNSAYIEGIGNLYEFDCGELSGWMYKVNGRFPNYGCSRYQLKEGDRVEWVYTCDLGTDVGGNYSARNGR